MFALDLRNRPYNNPNHPPNPNKPNSEYSFVTADLSNFFIVYFQCRKRDKFSFVSRPQISLERVEG
jgi:hypothetical protein